MAATEGIDVHEGVFTVDEGDEVHLAVHDYEWANPYEVTDVDHVDWQAATEGTWATREVILEGGYSSTFRVRAVEGNDDLDLRQHPGGQKRGDLERFEPVDEDESGTSTEDTSTSDDSESEAEAQPEPVLEEDAADDAPAEGDTDAGDDVQEEIAAEDVTVDAVDRDDEDDDGIVCEGCGQTFGSQAALMGHGPKSCEGGDADDIDLPKGVTEDDVDELTSGGIEIGDLADELGIHRNRARTIAHELGYYSRVREVWRSRDRAQIDPRATGILVLLLGLVISSVAAVGVMYP
ncbi:hypothetical protein [Natrinema salifodinae]|uniref:Uncharacterized protein n=1 Tax=Natrinema salifodinae TaxID=1202768 RepID=A0A1I0P7A1_9EURY|nr:hypothetical protein [Natrinema salifodinae]SEW09909.1 hypothetical protein SAMN05216285_2203 [Natrinema salifodinae]